MKAARITKSQLGLLEFGCHDEHFLLFCIEGSPQACDVLLVELALLLPYAALVIKIAACASQQLPPFVGGSGSHSVGLADRGDGVGNAMIGRSEG